MFAWILLNKNVWSSSATLRSGAISWGWLLSLEPYAGFCSREHITVKWQVIFDSVIVVLRPRHERSGDPFIGGAPSSDRTTKIWHWDVEENELKVQIQKLLGRLAVSTTNYTVVFALSPSSSKPILQAESLLCRGFYRSSNRQYLLVWCCEPEALRCCQWMRRLCTCEFHIHP